MEKVKVFFIPYSGASAMIYNKWKEHLNDKIIFTPIEFPARGKRYRDSLCETADELVEDLYKQIEKEIDGTPFAFFGHCIGGALGYELAMKIKREKGQEPRHMFFSGRQVPHVEYHRSFSTMSEEEFFQEVISLEQNLQMIYQEKSLREIYVPIFKADLLMSETYSHTYDENRSKLNCDITVLAGTEDRFVNNSDVAGWKEYTTKKCNFHTFEDGHFFLHNNFSNMVEIINNAVC